MIDSGENTVVYYPILPDPDGRINRINSDYLNNLQGTQHNITELSLALRLHSEIGNTLDLLPSIHTIYLHKSNLRGDQYKGYKKVINQLMVLRYFLCETDTNEINELPLVSATDGGGGKKVQTLEEKKKREKEREKNNTKQIEREKERETERERERHERRYKIYKGQNLMRIFTLLKEFDQKMHLNQLISQLSPILTDFYRDNKGYYYSTLQTITHVNDTHFYASKFLDDNSGEYDILCKILFTRLKEETPVKIVTKIAAYYALLVMFILKRERRVDDNNNFVDDDNYKMIHFLMQSLNLITTDNLDHDMLVCIYSFIYAILNYDINRTFRRIIENDTFKIIHDDREDDDMNYPFVFNIADCAYHYFSNICLPSSLLTDRESITMYEDRVRPEVTLYFPRMPEQIASDIDRYKTYNNSYLEPFITAAFITAGEGKEPWFESIWSQAVRRVNMGTFEINTFLRSVLEQVKTLRVPEPIESSRSGFMGLAQDVNPVGVAGGLNHRHTKLKSKRNKPIKIYTKNKNNNKIKTRKLKGKKRTRKLKGKKRTLKKRRNKTNKRHK